MIHNRRRLKVVSTAKHFQAYDCENCRALGDLCMPNSEHACSTDRTNFNAVVSKQEQVEYYWPPWRAAAAGAGVKSVMCSCKLQLHMATPTHGRHAPARPPRAREAAHSC